MSDPVQTKLDIPPVHIDVQPLATHANALVPGGATLAAAHDDQQLDEPFVAPQRTLTPREQKQTNLSAKLLNIPEANRPTFIDNMAQLSPEALTAFNKTVALNAKHGALNPNAKPQDVITAATNAAMLATPPVSAPAPTVGTNSAPAPAAKLQSPAKTARIITSAVTAANAPASNKQATVEQPNAFKGGPPPIKPPQPALSFPDPKDIKATDGPRPAGAPRPTDIKTETLNASTKEGAGTNVVSYYINEKGEKIPLGNEVRSPAIPKGPKPRHGAHGSYHAMKVENSNHSHVGPRPARAKNLLQPHMG